MKINSGKLQECILFFLILSNSFLLDKKVVFVRVVSSHLKEKIASNLIKSMNTNIIFIYLSYSQDYNCTSFEFKLVK